MNSGTKRLLCLLLCVTLLLGCVGTASAAKKKNSLMVNDLGDLMDDWYYVPSTVPEGFLNQEKAVMSIYNTDGSDGKTESATTCEITFKKGDEALRDVLVAEQNAEGQWEVYVDNSKITAPGKANFHLVAESESYLFERDYTINVLDWGTDPLLEIKNDKPVIEAKIGQTIWDQDLENTVFDLHTGSIFDKLKIKIRSWAASDFFFLRNNSNIEYSGDGLVRQDDYSNFNMTHFYIIPKDYGDHQLTYTYTKGNIQVKIPVTISVKGYAITADSRIAEPGGTIQYSVKGTTEGRTFTWAVDGKGAAIDENGKMTIAADAEDGTLFTVTATADNGDVLTAHAFINQNGVLKVDQWNTVTAAGFDMVYPQGEKWTVYGGQRQNEVFVALTEPDEQGNTLYMDGTWFTTGNGKTWEFLEDPEKAKPFIEDMVGNSPNYENYAMEIIDLDGHPCGVASFTYYSNGSFYAHMAILFYVRNNRILRYRLYSQNEAGAAPEQIPKATLNDVKMVACLTGYNPASAPFTLDNAALTLTAKDNAVAVTAGKTLQFTAAFADQVNISAKEKNNGVTWSVVKADSGEEDAAATINNKGLLKIDKGLAATAEFEVKAVSDVFGTTASYKVTAVPVVSKVLVEPAELFFYVGKEDPQTVKAALEPDTVPPIGITWTPAKKDIVEIIDNGDGTAVLKPLKAGKTTVAVKEPGGKNAKLNVSVVDPVESVELEVKGNAKAGGTVTVDAALQPKTAGNKNLEWSLDVGEDIATIDAKGKVKISKEAASGTKITVTCKALGAPEPIVATAVIEIP